MKTIEIEVNDDIYQRWMNASTTYHKVLELGNEKQGISVEEAMLMVCIEEFENVVAARQALHYGPPEPNTNLRTEMFRFFSTHEGADAVLTKVLAQKRYGLTDDQYNSWLGLWRSEQKPDA